MTEQSLGLFTKRQIEVLRLRAEGLSQEAVANQLKTTRENVSIIEKRAYGNIQRARHTLTALKTFGVSVSIVIKPRTHIVDIPRIIFDKADEAGIKVRASFMQVYEEVRFKARDKVKHTRVSKPITIRILHDGDYIIE